MKIHVCAVLLLVMLASEGAAQPTETTGTLPVDTNTATETTAPPAIAEPPALPPPAKKARAKITVAAPPPATNTQAATTTTPPPATETDAPPPPTNTAPATATPSDTATTKITTGTTSPPPNLWLALLLASTFFSIAAFTLLARTMIRAKRVKPEASEIAKKLHDAVTNLGGSLLFVDEKLQLASATVAGKLESASILTKDDLAPVTAEMDKLRQEIGRLATVVEDAATRPGTPPAPAPAIAQGGFERDILSEQWKQFRANKELSAAYDGASQQNEWEQLIEQLTALVPGDLKPTFDAVMAPWREHRNLVSKVGLVPRLISGEIPPRKSDAEEAWRARDFAAVLTAAQSSEGSRQLTFRLKSWITETFLPFADLYLQRYQQAQLERRGNALQPGVTLVRQLLSLAAVEPIDVTPGETSFDSTRHIGRSTSNDPRFSDGVITGVVRNGFIEGQQVIRQPEVIVNRMR